MVYLHFPSNLTEEEQMLQTKYQKLRRKKKALIALKAPKAEPEPMLPSKRPLEAKDAKEMAKKLIKSGAIKVPERMLPITEKTTFKRSIGLERKLSAVEKAPSGYQPFSTSHPEDEVHESRLKTKGLYDSFIVSRDTDDKTGTKISDTKPRQGNTIYVYGHNITEELLTSAFNAFGNIININMEAEKNRGFVTFDKMESAEKAIAEMNGGIVSSVQLKVALARRQPSIETPSSETASTPNWSTLAASHSQKGSHKDKREMVIYDDSLF